MPVCDRAPWIGLRVAPLVATFVALLLAPSLACQPAGGPLSRALAELRLPIEGVEKMRLQSEGDSLDPLKASLSASDGRSWLRVEAWKSRTREQALEQVRRQHAIIRSSYRAMTSPYVAHITREIGCPAGFLPRTLGTGKHRYVSLSVTARLAYGACSVAEAAYAGALFFLFDSGSGTAFKVELFTPSSDLDPEALDAFVRANTSRLENIT